MASAGCRLSHASAALARRSRQVESTPCQEVDSGVLDVGVPQILAQIKQRDPRSEREIELRFRTNPLESPGSGHEGPTGGEGVLLIMEEILMERDRPALIVEFDLVEGSDA